MLKSVLFSTALVCSLALVGCKTSSEKKAEEGNAKIQKVHATARKMMDERNILLVADRGNDEKAVAHSIDSLNRLDDATLDSTISELNSFADLVREIVSLVNSKDVTFSGDLDAYERAGRNASILAAEGRAIRAERKARGNDPTDDKQCNSMPRTHEAVVNGKHYCTEYFGNTAKEKYDSAAGDPVSLDTKEFQGEKIIEMDVKGSKPSCWRYRTESQPNCVNFYCMARQ